MRRSPYLFAALLPIASCAPAPPAVQVPPVELAAPFEKAWNAVIDVFAEQNIPIATIDKSSGLIVASSLAISDSDGKRWASCRRGLLHPAANRADFNILVRPMATGSSVRATARWTLVNRDGVVNCSSLGVWERSLQVRLKNAADGTP